MKQTRTYLLVANWKANPHTVREAKQIFTAAARAAARARGVELVVAPSYAHLSVLRAASRTAVLAAQDISLVADGPHTGIVGFEQLLDLKTRYVIIGHSERRAAGETNELVGEKCALAVSLGIRPIICIGEHTREVGSTEYLTTIKSQLVAAFHGVSKSKVRDIVVAYEPVWAIGRDAVRDARPDEIKEVAIFIRRVIGDLYETKSVPPLTIIYGGSVDAKNAAYILEESGVDGFLVGRASLEPKTFSAIISASHEIARRS